MSMMIGLVAGGSVIAAGVTQESVGGGEVGLHGAGTDGAAIG